MKCAAVATANGAGVAPYVQRPRTAPRPNPLETPKTGSADQDYLAKARKAAQAQSTAKKSENVFDRNARYPGRLALSLTAGLAVSLLIGGVWAIKHQTTDAGGGELQSTASLTTSDLHVSRTSNYASDYDNALLRIDAGDADDGVALLRRAAEAGSPMAQYRLAKFYERGEGVPRNLRLARLWAERAARAGNCRAMHDLGVYYALGEGAPLDEAMAFRWFSEAAELGVADSQYNLGILYRQGRGVGANNSQALFWFLVAARQHDLNAVDRAVEVAAQLSPMHIENAQVRARAFQARPANASVNGVCSAQSLSEND